MSVADVLPEIAVLVAAVAALLTASFVTQPRQWLGAPIALAGLASSAAFLLAQLGAGHLTFAGVWALDGASVWARLMIVVATGVTVAMTPQWFARDRRHGEYYAILLLSALGAMLLAGAADTLQLMVGVLLSSATGYTLAAYHRDWALSVEAGMKYFLIGALTNTLLMIGVTLLFGLYGATGYTELATAVGGAIPGAMTLVALSLIVIGVVFKLGAVPAHTWVPDVAEGAPAPAAAFLTVVPKIGGAIALARVVAVFPAETVAWRPVLATLAVATMTVGNLAALRQTDVRRLLGWSSVSQAGYALMAIVVLGLTDAALPALLYFLAAYALGTLAAFGVITHLRGRTEIDQYRGLGLARPGAALVLVVSFLSLVGIPPLAGFVGKLTLFVATVEAGYTWLAVVAVLNTVVSLYYYLRIVGPLYFDEAHGTMYLLGRPSAIGMFTAGAATLLLGVFAEPWWNALQGAVIVP